MSKDSFQQSWFDREEFQKFLPEIIALIRGSETMGPPDDHSDSKSVPEIIRYLFQKFPKSTTTGPDDPQMILTRVLSLLGEYKLANEKNLTGIFCNEYCQDIVNILFRYPYEERQRLILGDFDKILQHSEFIADILFEISYPSYHMYFFNNKKEFDDCFAKVVAPDMKLMLSRKSITTLGGDITIDSPIEAHVALAHKNIYSRPFPHNNYDSDSEDDNHENKFRTLHDIVHVTGAAFLVVILVNLYARHGDQEARALTALIIKLLQIAALYHDSGREGEGKDYWDRDSGLILYYYLTEILKVEDELAKQLAEAVANKDVDQNKNSVYYQLINYTPGKVRWQRLKEIPKANIFRKVLRDVDCFEIRRVQEFNAQYLSFFAIAIESPPALEELAQLITEVQGGIEDRGDDYLCRNIKFRNQNFNHENAYQAIHNLFIKNGTDIIAVTKTINRSTSSPDLIAGSMESANFSLDTAVKPRYDVLSFMENKESKTDPLVFDRRDFYRIIPLLYNPAGFHEGISLSELPTEAIFKDLLQNPWEKNLREGRLFARGIEHPTMEIPPAISKRTQRPKDPRTKLDFELEKIKRRPGKLTRGGSNNKHGLDFRSTSMMGFKAGVFTHTGYVIINPDRSVIRLVSHANINSGKGKKIEFQKKFKEEKFPGSQLTVCELFLMPAFDAEKCLEIKGNAVILVDIEDTAYFIIDGKLATREEKIHYVKNINRQNISRCETRLLTKIDSPQDAVDKIIHEAAFKGAHFELCNPLPQLFYYIKTGYHPNRGRNATPHNEVIMKLTRFDAVYYSLDRLKKGSEWRGYARILEAIALALAYLKTHNGRLLPILQYSSAPTAIIPREFTPEHILKIWLAVCTDYKKWVGNLAGKSMSLQEFKTRSVYGDKLVDKKASPIRDLGCDYDKELSCKINAAIVKIKDQWMSLSSSSIVLMPSPSIHRQRFHFLGQVKKFRYNQDK
jgi:RPE4 domain-containing protein